LLIFVFAVPKQETLTWPWSAVQAELRPVRVPP